MVLIHKPLGTNTFRLLKLEEGPGINFSFIYATTNDPPQYATLSYTWGDQISEESIHVNGRAFQVTHNLRDALDALLPRIRASRPLLWVDAVCINQEDRVERSSQVRIMRDIYQRSRSVWIWLGNSSNDSDLALQKLKEFATLFFEHSPGAGMLATAETAAIILSPKNAQIYGPPGSSTMNSWEAIMALLRRPWWNRTWIVQEATCPVQTTLFCGSEHAEWEHVFGTARLMAALDMFPEVDFHINVTLAPFIRLSTIKTARRDKISAGLELTELVTLTSSMVCRDPRDRIYALVGIASDIAPGSLVPDYCKSIEEVYQDFVRFSRATSLPGHELDFLGSLNIASSIYPEAVSEAGADEAPSWMPLWKPHVRVDPFAKFFQGKLGRVYSADGNAMSHIFLHDFKLHVKGFSFDQIQSLTEVSTDNQDPTFEMQWYRALPHTDLYRTGQSLREAGRHTLSADISKIGGRGHAVSRGDIIDFSYELVQSSHLNSAGLEEKRSKRRTIKAATSGRRLMQTQRGAIGIAPAAAQVKDMICVFYGGSVLYILRKQRTLDYTFIGECYVHGFMDGEAATFLENGQVKENLFTII